MSLIRLSIKNLQARGKLKSMNCGHQGASEYAIAAPTSFFEVSVP